MNTETAAPTEGPNALPVKVTNEPVDGVKRENCAMVLVRNRIATIAVRMVKGAASPAPCTITAKPKKKLIAGAMLARVEATIWPRESAFRCNLVSLPFCRLDTVLLTDMCPLVVELAFTRQLLLCAGYLSFVFDLVTQYADFFDFDFAHISVLHKQLRLPRHAN